MITTFAKYHPLQTAALLGDFDPNNPPRIQNVSKTTKFDYTLISGPAPDNKLGVEWAKMTFLTKPFVTKSTWRPNGMGDHDEIVNPPPDAEFDKKLGAEARTVLTRNDPIWDSHTRIFGNLRFNSAIIEIATFCAWFGKEMAKRFLEAPAPLKISKKFDEDYLEYREEFAKASPTEKDNIIRKFLRGRFVRVQKETKHVATATPTCPSDPDKAGEQPPHHLNERSYFVFRQLATFPLLKDDPKQYVPTDPKLLADLNYINSQAGKPGGPKERRIYNPCEVYVLDAVRKHWVKLSSADADKPWANRANLVVSVMFTASIAEDGGPDTINNSLRTSAICIWGIAGDQVAMPSTRDNTVYITDPAAMSVLDSMPVVKKDARVETAISDEDMLSALDNAKRKYESNPPESDEVERHPIENGQQSTDEDPSKMPKLDR